MALLYGPGPDPLGALSVLYGPPVWSWARPPLGPSPSCMALLYGPGPDPVWGPLRLVWPSCMVLGPTLSGALSVLYGPPVWSWARPSLGPSPSCMALLYGPGPDPLWGPLRLVW